MSIQAILHRVQSLPAKSIFVVLVLAASSISSVKAAARYTVVIDPGHGGKDPGAYYGGVKEKTVAYDLARRVESILRSRGIPTTMTRRGDYTVSRPKRVWKAKRYSRSIFVSLHYNATRNGNRRVRGIETFYYSSAGRELAKHIQYFLKHRTRAADRGVKRARYDVLRLNGSRASVLVEGGFLSNYSDRKLIKSAAYRAKQANAIAEGIINYLRVKAQG